MLICCTQLSFGTIPHLIGNQKAVIVTVVDWKGAPLDISAPQHTCTQSYRPLWHTSSEPTDKRTGRGSRHGDMCPGTNSISSKNYCAIHTIPYASNAGYKHAHTHKTHAHAQRKQQPQE